MDERTDSGEFYPGGDRRGGDPIDLTFDDAVTRTSARAVKSSGIWSAIWGALAALPAEFTSFYDWVVAQLVGKVSTSGGIVHGLLESDKPLGQSFTGLGVNGMVGYYGGIRWGVRIGTGDNVDFPVLLNKNGGEIVVPSATGTLALLSDIPDVSGKADAADLRYRIAEAAVRKTLPADCFPVTFTYEGVSHSINELVTEEEASAAGDMYIEDYGDSYSIAMVLQPETESEAAQLLEVAYLDADGVFESSGLQDLQFGGVSPFADTSPTLADIQVLADRTGNLITARNGTASIDIELPEAVTVEGVRYCRDLIVDVDNSSAGTSDIDIELASDETAYLDAGGARYLVAVADGDDLADLLTVAAGARARLYFTETAQTATPAGGTEAVPVISLQRLTVVVGGAA